MEVSLVAAMVKRWLGFTQPEKSEGQPKDQLKGQPKDAPKGQPMWRQGDVLIRRVEAIPERVQQSPLPHGILARGELTGHSHRLENQRSAMLFSGARTIGELYLDVPAGGALVRELRVGKWIDAVDGDVQGARFEQACDLFELLTVGAHLGCRGRDPELCELFSVVFGHVNREQRAAGLEHAQ